MMLTDEERQLLHGVAMRWLMAAWERTKEREAAGEDFTAAWLDETEKGVPDFDREFFAIMLADAEEPRQ